MLKIKIDNFDKLPNGGPLEFVADRRGFDFGRDQHLDWTLPDKNRVVSGKHCEVRFYENAYWLLDFSTNGTFVNNSPKRVQSPYRLMDGDQLAVGDYMLSVSVSLPDAEPMQQQHTSSLPIIEPAPQPESFGGNIWDAPHAAPPPIDARELMPHQPEHERAPDFLQHAAYIAPILDAEPPRKPQPAAPPAIAADANPWSTGKSVIERKPAPPPADVPAPLPVPPAPVAPPPPVVVAAPASPTEAQEFVRRFAKGAGLGEDALSRLGSGELAEKSGQLLNLMCLHLMSLLRARAEAKSLSRSGNRTLIQAADNNPLKFMPTAEEALKVMLGPKSQGYLDGRQAVESTFADLKLHQVALLGALQAAAGEILTDISPEAIAKSAESKRSLIPGNKSKNWDAYVEAWTRKAGTREHGMLGAFLDAFAEHYDRLSRK